MIDRKIIDRVLKCLALAKSSNEHEAAAALAKARQIMDEYGISDGDIALAEVEEACARSCRTNRPPSWEVYLCQAVQDAMGVSSFITAEGDRQFVGLGPSAEIAAYAYGVLFRQLQRQRKEYIATKLRRCSVARKRVRANAFCLGWSRAVYAKIEALAPKAIDPKVQQYLAERYPNLVSVSSRQGQNKRTDNDFWRGADRGHDVQLHGGVSGGASPALLHSL